MSQKRFYTRETIRGIRISPLHTGPAVVLKPRSIKIHLKKLFFCTFLRPHVFIKLRLICFWIFLGLVWYYIPIFRNCLKKMKYPEIFVCTSCAHFCTFFNFKGLYWKLFTMIFFLTLWDNRGIINCFFCQLKILKNKKNRVRTEINDCNVMLNMTP